MLIKHGSADTKLYILELPDPTTNEEITDAVLSIVAWMYGFSYFKHPKAIEDLLRYLYYKLCSVFNIKT